MVAARKEKKIFVRWLFGACVAFIRVIRFGFIRFIRLEFVRVVHLGFIRILRFGFRFIRFGFIVFFRFEYVRFIRATRLFCFGLFGASPGFGAWGLGIGA